ncbi:stage III sporulation protein AH [Ornithinibacillus sp. 179-J 7C1 HS]|uniref:stage III sporulation protein AH n=1 Tax=Ornithinibacillus sp. 179-J 7C1 HS TaxID=3142384 RepID=UPI0039A0F615
MKAESLNMHSMGLHSKIIPPIWQVKDDKMYEFLEETKGEKYKNLLDFACSICDSFQLVIRTDMGNPKEIRKILREIEAHKIKMEVTSEWASTMLDGETAEVYFYKTNEDTLTFLKNKTNSLHGWIYPYLPEDLSFFKNNQPWLINISHEKSTYLKTENPSEVSCIKNIGIKLTLC